MSNGFDIMPPYKCTKEVSEYRIKDGHRQGDQLQFKYDISIIVEKRFIEGGNREIEFNICNGFDCITLTDPKKIMELFTIMNELMKEPMF